MTATARQSAQVVDLQIVALFSEKSSRLHFNEEEAKLSFDEVVAITRLSCRDFIIGAGQTPTPHGDQSSQPPRLRRKPQRFLHFPRRALVHAPLLLMTQSPIVLLSAGGHSAARGEVLLRRHGGRKLAGVRQKRWIQDQAQSTVATCSTVLVMPTTPRGVRRSKTGRWERLIEFVQPAGLLPFRA